MSASTPTCRALGITIASSRHPPLRARSRGTAQASAALPVQAAADETKAAEAEGQQSQAVRREAALRQQLKAPEHVARCVSQQQSMWRGACRSSSGGSLVPCMVATPAGVNQAGRHSDFRQARSGTLGARALEEFD